MRMDWHIAAVVGLALAFAQADAVAGTTVPTPIDGTYKLVFDDEFNGTTVNTSKWNILSNNTIGGGYTNDDFEPSCALEGSGFLTLLANTQTSGRPYRAAFIDAKPFFSYSYWEARCKMPPNGHGMWPAFWMNNGGTYPEIDIFEWLGNGPTVQWATYHPVNDVALTGGAGLGSTYTGADFSSAFHVYGLLWQANSITWYLDGVQVFQLTQGQQFNCKTVDITSTAMQPIFTAAVGGWNSNVPDSSTVFPAGFVVDYIHIYSNASNATAVTPDTGYNGPGDAVGSGNSPQIYKPPAITNGPPSATLPVSSSYNFTYATTGYPAPTFSVATGALPAGLALSSSGAVTGTPTTPGVYTGSISANNTIDPAATQTFSIQVANTFSSWGGQYFSSQQLLDSTISGPNATPENDHVTNLLKYLFDINPTTIMGTSDIAAMPATGMATIGSTHYLTLTYRQNSSLSGITINAQTSSDLVTWQTVTPDFTQSAGTDANTGDPMIQIDVSTGTSTSKFIRLNVTSP